MFVSISNSDRIPLKFVYYGGWKKSCTTLDGWNPINNGINHLSTGAGFLPSTVSVIFLDSVYFLPLRLDGCLQVPLDGLDATAEPYSPPQPKMRPVRGEMPSFCWWNLWNPHVWWNSRNSTAKVTLWVELAIFGWKPDIAVEASPPRAMLPLEPAHLAAMMGQSALKQGHPEPLRHRNFHGTSMRWATYRSRMSECLKWY